MFLCMRVRACSCVCVCEERGGRGVQDCITHQSNMYLTINKDASRICFVAGFTHQNKAQDSYINVAEGWSVYGIKITCKCVGMLAS